MFPLYRIAVVLALVQVALSVPLKIAYDRDASGAATKANKDRLDAATTLANSQIVNMRKGLDKAKAGDAKAKVLYEATFGKAGANSDINKVDQTVKALETGTMTAKVAAHPFRNGEIAAVPWSQNKKTDPWVAGPVRFSKQFHGDGDKPLDANGRAGTIIHEATHQLKGTGDDVHKTNGKIIPVSGEAKDAHATLTGYTSAHNMHKTVAEVKKDKAFTGVRDKATNMHENAESYALFASLCSQPGVLRRRDIHPFNRALVEGDDEQLEYLARRNSCKLPPNHIAKKAAAKKAEAAKKSAKSPVIAKKSQANGKVLLRSG
ncbi:hypothetical protein CPB83DRAFT_387415 [Crepidotus variabilis]|uniref:Lysine-specific metallo-endopeptidase domain-containing protein n=1 Tax=Crepidotus variabilis TaxID=179855 RepID=A0A9P6EEX3_9AGAR|nr:hypothetical protein CPB83DRAFT_387415 [Crepidotus variabilis]